MIRRYNPTTTNTVIVGVNRDKVENSRQYWRYILTWNSKVIFSNNDLNGTIYQSEDDALVSAIGFLSLKPGDTDEEYFENYTQDQLDWANSYACECMSIYADE